MRKIEGNEKQVCVELHKRIYKILSSVMPHDIMNREISFEWCNAGTYLGQCLLERSSNVAIVRISRVFDFDRSTIAHEILHALLPYHVKHGLLFTKAMTIINDVLNLNVTIVATRELSQTCRKVATPYKYAIVNKETGGLLFRCKRYCKKIKDCRNNEATDPAWNYTVIPYDVYLNTKERR